MSQVNHDNSFFCKIAFLNYNVLCPCIINILEFTKNKSGMPFINLKNKIKIKIIIIMLMSQFRVVNNNY